MKSVVPRLDTLPQAQRTLWPQLAAIGSDFVLYGGTALSLQVGGRISVDFDFFTVRRFDTIEVMKQLPMLNRARLQHRSGESATFIVGNDRDAVAISFFGGLEFGRVSDPVQFTDNGVFAAGLLDLAAQKIKVIQQRAEAKDYLDIHKLLSVGITLEQALGAAGALYPEFNPAVSLKALSYFADVARLPQEIQDDLQMAAAKVREIPQMVRQNESLLPDIGSLAKEHSREIEPELEL
jgi:hypothetical protein